MKKKKTIKRNQIVIAALTVLLGVAGYINFSGNTIRLAPGERNTEDTEAVTESAFAEEDLTATNLDAGEVTVWDLEPEEYIELNSDEQNIGEAVLTSTGVTSNFVGIKLEREQTRSLNKEMLLEIINGDGMDTQAVQSATDAYIKLTETAEMEQEVEAILSAKGIGDAIVSVSADGVDVVINCGELTDVQRAQIEDVVVRKTGCDVSQIVITTMVVEG